jgi:hypothetical protein
MPSQQLSLPSLPSFGFPSVNPWDWAQSIGNHLAGLVANWYANIMGGIVESLLSPTLPSVDQLRNPYFLVGLGGTLGLATRLITLVAVIVGLMVVLTPTKNHGKKLSKLLSSFLVLGLFAALFYPVYSMMYNLSKESVQALINLALGTTDGSAADVSKQFGTSVLPHDPAGKAITAILGIILDGGVWVEQWALVVWLYALLLFYPLVVVVRSLGRAAEMLFHAFNAGLVAITLAPPCMAVGYLLPELVRKYVPGLGTQGITAFASTVLGGLFALFVPLALVYLTFKKSSEVFGKMDANVAGKLDINSMPTVTTQEMQESVDGTHSSAMSSFVKTMGLGALTADLGNSDDVWGDLKSLAVEAATVAAASTGHVEVAAALELIDTTTTKDRRKQNARDHRSSEGR